MISVEAAQALIRDRVATLDAERVALSAAAGRVLAEDLRARLDLPRFDNSAMDGYAVRSADVAGARAGAPALLRVRGLAPAGGDARLAVGRGEAARIFTGAPLPAGADCVVMQERTRRRNGLVRVLDAAVPGQHVRPCGGDVRAGRRLLERGTTLRPYEVALLAAQGLERVSVVRRPRVAVVATGDELSCRGGRLGRGRIHDANGPAVCAALARWGIAPVGSRPVKDDPAALRRALAPLARASDVLLVSGGVSVGDRDFTRDALRSLGFREVFWKVAIKPGKPLWFAAKGPRLAFGLPGNPVAALVCVEEFVRPALEGLQGRRLGYPSYHLAGRAANAYPAAAGRRQYLFCVASGGPGAYRLRIIRPQGSAMLGMACEANALALAPRGGRVEAGDELAFRWLK